LRQDYPFLRQSKRVASKANIYESRSASSSTGQKRKVKEELKIA